MGRRGRKRQLGIEDEYWRLILGGVGTVERPADEPASAARPGTGGEPSTAGARRSGWRRQCAASATCLSSSASASPPCGTGHRCPVIARRLKRSPSTISHELRRNTAAQDGGIYDERPRSCARPRAKLPAPSGASGRRRRAPGQAPGRHRPTPQQPAAEGAQVVDAGRSAGLAPALLMTGCCDDRPNSPCSPGES